MDEQRSQEDRLVYCVSIPTLQSVSSHQIALSICKSYISSLKHNNDSRLRDRNFFRYRMRTAFKDIAVRAETLNTPKSIEKLIKTALDRIRNELSKWAIELCEVILNDLNCCVWSIDGKIDRERSATKVLSIVSELSNAQKFDIMCEYCLEDEIVKFPMDSLPADFMEEVWRQENKLMEYWYYYAKREYRLTPMYADVVMECGPNKWIPFQYFWHRMSTDWQIRIAESIFNNVIEEDIDDMDTEENYGLGHTANIGRFFMIISWQLQRHLLNTKLMDVILMLIKYGDALKPVRWIWMYYKNSITVRDFVDIIQYFTDHKLNAEEWMNWLIYVWDSVSDQFKIAAAERIKNSMLDRFNFYDKPSHSAFTFLSKILLLQDMDFRKEIILKQAVNFGICIVDHHSMNEVLELCLPNKDERSNFEKMVVESGEMKSTCMELIRNSNLDHLNMMLNFYLTSSDNVQKFKKELLKSKTFVLTQFIFHVHDWCTLSRFIDEIYPENKSLASRTKKQLITSWNVKYIGNMNNDAIHLIRIVESEFGAVEVDTLKRVWIHSVRKMLESQDYHWCANFVKNKSTLLFLRWCVGDGDRAIPEYEYEAFVDTIFDAVFRTLDEYYTGEWDYWLDDLLLTRLETYLKLFLISDEKVKKYKSSRMTSSNVMKIFRAVRSQNDASSLHILSNWCYQSV